MKTLADLYFSGLSIPQISKQTEIPLSTVRNRLLRDGVVLRSKSDGIKIASAQGRLGTGRIGKKFPMSQETRKKLSAAKLRLGEATARGVRIKSSGYVEYTRGENKGRGVHVVVMERHIGRRLAPNEVVHHIDENKQNNNLDNLALMTNSAHSRLHRLLDALHGKERERQKNGRFC